MTPKQWLASRLTSERLKETQLYAYALAMAAYLDDDAIADIFAGEAKADGHDWELDGPNPDNDEHPDQQQYRGHDGACTYRSQNCDCGWGDEEDKHD